MNGGREKMLDLTAEMARLKKSLDAIEEEAYRLFAKYPAPSGLTAYPEDLDPEETRKVRANLRGMSPELFACYNDASFDWTPTNELRHFLPRYLEEIDAFRFPSEESVFHRFVEWENYFERDMKTLRSRFSDPAWTKEERDLIDRWYRTFCARFFLDYPVWEADGHILEIRVDVLIILFAHGGFAVETLLEVWREHLWSLPALLHLKDLLLYGFSDDFDKLRNSFASHDKTLHSMLIGWLKDSKTRKCFLEGCDAAIKRCDALLFEETWWHGTSYLDELEYTRETLLAWAGG
jgi:hypothetical protein